MLKPTRDCGHYSQDLKYQNRLSQTMVHILLPRNFKNSAGEMEFDTSLLHPTTQYRMAWQNEVCKYSREATKNSQKGLWRIAWLDLCCNMPSHHTQPLDIVHQSYCSEESYALVWTRSNWTLDSLLKRNSFVRRRIIT